MLRHQCRYHPAHCYDYGDVHIPGVRYGRGYSRYTEDCSRFIFGVDDNEIMSEKARLYSDEYIEECRYVPVADPGGVINMVRRCHERRGQSWSRTVQLNIKPRILFPWEKETFNVCLKGPHMDIYFIDTAYKYHFRKITDHETLFELTPEYKKAKDPDLNGIQFIDFKYDERSERYTLKVEDIWAKEYAGEKIFFKIELRRDIPYWFDASKGEKEITFDTNGEYEISFFENELIKGRFDKDIQLLKGPKKFFLKWGFKRIGKISTDKFMKKGETPRVEK